MNKNNCDISDGFHTAYIYNNGSVIRMFLIDYKNDVYNYVNLTFYLFDACQNKKYEIVRILLQHDIMFSDIVYDNDVIRFLLNVNYSLHGNDISMLKGHNFDNDVLINKCFHLRNDNVMRISNIINDNTNSIVDWAHENIMSIISQYIEY
jgi:hypothetical protein